jgi:hypothetical protein
MRRLTLLIAIGFICRANADIFSSPKDYWALCGKAGVSPPAECSVTTAMPKLKEICSLPANKADCTKIAQAYQFKTLQPEAKNTLGMLYTQEQSKMVTTNRYSDNLEAVWTAAIRDTKKTFYIFSIKSCNNIGGGVPTSLQFGWQLKPEIASDAKALLEQLKRTLSDIPCPKPTEFIAVAVGKISPTGSPDIWTIDQNGKLKNLQNGIPDPFE